MKEISLKFVLKTDSGKTENFIVQHVKENVSDEEISVYADKVIRNDYLVPKEGTKFVEIDKITKVIVTEERVM